MYSQKERVKVLGNAANEIGDAVETIATPRSRVLALGNAYQNLEVLHVVLLVIFASIALFVFRTIRKAKQTGAIKPSDRDYTSLM